MKLVFAVLFLGLFFGFSGKANAATKMDVSDVLNEQCFLGDSTYLYCKNQNTLTRTTSFTVTPTAAHTFTGYSEVTNVWTLSSGTILVEVLDASNNSFVFRSTDHGSTFSSSAVLTEGCANFPTCSSQISGVDILPKGLTELNGVIYAGEYNTNGSRTAGSTNDQVRLMKSNDDGATWSEVSHWNTDGSHNNITHIHAVQNDGSRLYVSFGDTNNTSAILMWDPVTSPPANNQNVNTYSDCWFGDQRYRTGGLIFPPGDYAYFMADSTTLGLSAPANGSSVAGIWRIKKGDSSVAATRVNSDSPMYYPSHSGWTGIVMADGTLVFAEYIPDNDPSDQPWSWQAHFFTSDDNGATWTDVGKYTNRTQGGGEFFNWKGTTFYARNGAGQSAATTALYNAGAYTESDQVILGPIWWVGSTGTNNLAGSNGLRPTTPWLTLKYALENNKITYGARVIVQAGTFSEAGIVPLWSNQSLKTPATALETVIEGAGSASTTIYQPVSDAATALFTINKDMTPVLFKNMKVYTRKAADVFNIVAHSGGLKAPVYLSSMVVGDKRYPALANVSLNQNIQVDKTTFFGSPVTDGIIYGSATAYAKITSSILDGHNRSLYHGYAGTAMDILGSELRDYATYGYVNGDSANILPTIRDTVFYSALGTADYDDTSGMTEDDNHLDYNHYGGTLINVANSGGTHKTIGDPIIVSTSTDNVVLPSESVTLANSRISYLDGAAFFDRGTVGLGAYIGAKIDIYDHLNNKITGYIKAAGTTETYGEQLHTTASATSDSAGNEINGTTGWSINGGSTLSADSNSPQTGIYNLKGIYGSSNKVAYWQAPTTIGALFKFDAWLKNGNATSVSYSFLANLAGVSSTSWTETIKYGNASATSSQAGCYVNGSTTQYGYFDNISLKQVTAPGSNGVTIVSTPGGSVFNWTSKDAGFTYNDSAGYNYVITTNVTTNDLHKQSTSPTIDSGTNVGLTSDYENNPVPSGLLPDIGAYEYVAPLAIVPSAPTLSVISTSSINIVINANGNVDTAEYAIENITNSQWVQADGTLGASAVWQTRTAWGGDSGITNTGLSANTSYTYKVKARGTDYTETALSDGTAQTTLANPTITASVTPILNEIPTSVAIIEEITGTLHNYYISQPSASFTMTADNTTGSTVFFDASGSISNKGIVKYEWDFGDGATSEGIKAEHKYQSPGQYTVKLTVTDRAGRQNSMTKTIDIKPSIPTITNITAQGTNLFIEGKSDPDTLIYFTIHSETFNGQGLADKTGYWTYSLASASDRLGEGDHTIFALAAVKLADNSELRSTQSKTYDFKVSLDNGKLKIEMKKTRTWQYISLGLVLVIVAGFVLIRAKKRR